MSAGSFKLNLVRSSGSKIKSREWGEKKKTALSLGREKKITLIYFFKKEKPKKNQPSLNPERLPLKTSRVGETADLSAVIKRGSH